MSPSSSSTLERISEGPQNYVHLAGMASLKKLQSWQVVYHTPRSQSSNTEGPQGPLSVLKTEAKTSALSLSQFVHDLPYQVVDQYYL